MINHSGFNKYTCSSLELESLNELFLVVFFVRRPVCLSVRPYIVYNIDFLSRTTRSYLIKLVTKHYCVKDTQVCHIKGYAVLRIIEKDDVNILAIKISFGISLFILHVLIDTNKQSHWRYTVLLWNGYIVYIEFP